MTDGCDCWMLSTQGEQSCALMTASPVSAPSDLNSGEPTANASESHEVSFTEATLNTSTPLLAGCSAFFSSCGVAAPEDTVDAVSKAFFSCCMNVHKESTCTDLRDETFLDFEPSSPVDESQCGTLVELYNANEQWEED